MPTISLPLRYLLLSLLSLALLSISFYLGWHEKGIRVDNQIVRMEAEMKKAEATFTLSSASLQLNQMQATQQSEAEHEKSISSLHTYYSNLLRNRQRKSGGNGSVPTLPAAPTTIDGVATNCLPIAAQSAETTQQLINLQQWILEQQRLNPIQ